MIPNLEGKCLSQNRLGKSALTTNLEISMAYCKKRKKKFFFIQKDASIPPGQVPSNNGSVMEAVFILWFCHLDMERLRTFQSRQKESTWKTHNILILVLEVTPVTYA